MSQPPPSSENKICEKFHEQIGQLKEHSNRKDFDENFVKNFLHKGPTESLLIPTEEIRFGRNFDQASSFKEDHGVGDQQQNLLLLHQKRAIWMVRHLQGRQSLQHQRTVNYWQRCLQGGVN